VTPAPGRAGKAGPAGALLAAVLIGGLAGCGHAQEAPGHPQGGPPLHHVQAGAPYGVLPLTAAGHLTATTKPLSARELQRDTDQRWLGARLAGWGYRGGWQRTFQGESRSLTLVVSRSLSFTRPPGAAAFVTYLHQHAGSVYPFALTRRLTAAGHGGWAFLPPACACHLANPLVAGVIRDGRRVSWLEINGPRASPRLLVRLLASTAV
jgi:hypothetical protein